MAQRARLKTNLSMEDVQYVVRHSHPSTTRIYERCATRISCNLVERIRV